MPIVNIKNICHVVNNSDGDRFVGIKIDQDKIVVSFPLGYHLSESDQELRQDIASLLRVLSEFSSEKASELYMGDSRTKIDTNFPINAYLDIIRSYLENYSYYKEKEPQYKVNDHGKTDWSRTIKRQKPIITSNGSPIYMDRIVRYISPRDNQFITEIHKYCVYESFQRIGWLFTQYMPEKPAIRLDIKRAIIELNTKMSRTNNDNTRRLFSSMISILTYIDRKPDRSQVYFGTENFEYVWERLIDKVFGVQDKAQYFPKAYWHLDGAAERSFEALFPDTIMQLGDKYYVLDAKYYRFGTTNSPYHLPEGSSIHKQITYGEYISNNEKFIDKKTGAHPTVYNAFLLPYDSTKRQGDAFLRFGEASGEWRTKNHTYDFVQGILVDTNYLIKSYNGDHRKKIKQLASIIEYRFSN